MLEVMPWHSQIWQRLTSYYKSASIPSGLLLSGPAGIGKNKLAQRYSQFLLCKQPTDEFCGICRSCLLFQSGSHPDYFFIEPEEKSNTIKIEQIRNLTEKLNHTPALNGRQIAIISLAENMNKAASNALLKTLEEPRGDVTILLLSQQTSRVAATIRSRCQQLQVQLPRVAIALEWLSQFQSPQTAALYLAMADNLPLKALEYSQLQYLEVRDSLINDLQQVKSGKIDPITAAAHCLTLPELQLQLLISIVMDLIRVRFGLQRYLNNGDKLSALLQLSQSVSRKELFIFLEEIQEGARLVQSSNINLQLLMEKIFIKWRYQNEIS